MAGRKKTAATRGQLSMEGKRAVPQFDPRCYDGGKGPNPYLPEWIAEHAKPYHPETDIYQREPLTGIIPGSKATAVYNLHKYWSKKPHEAIMRYVEHFTDPDDLVLDPFSGSGSTALSALLLGRKAIALDLSPAATFITKSHCSPVDPDDLQAAFEELERRIQPEMDWLYATRCHKCGGDATTGYTVYSEVFECVRCNRKVALYDCPEQEVATGGAKPRMIHACPNCGEEINTRRSARCGQIPVEVSVICQSEMCGIKERRSHKDADPRKREYFERYDLGKIAEIEARPIPHWFPTSRMMNAPEGEERWGVKWRAGSSNFRTVDELYTKRNLWALAAVRAALCQMAPLGASSPSGALWATLTTVALTGGRMLREETRAIQAGTYYLPPVFREIRISNGLDYKMLHLLCAHSELAAQLPLSLHAVISTQSACDLGAVPSASVDYVFTDPAYGDKVQYGELNFIWEAWLGLETRWHDQEIVVNPVREQDEERWYRMMLQAMRECYRVLKPGRWLSLCYHDTSDGTWDLVQQLMDEAGFIPDTSEKTAAIDAAQKSYNQLKADQVLKRDLVINFRKPRPGERPIQVGFNFDAADTPALFEQKVIGIVHAYLTKYPGSTRDYIWDAVVSRLVRQGDMQRHDFDSILQQVAAANEAGEWFLLEPETEQLGSAETERENAAAAALAKFIEKQQAETGRVGCEYGTILQWYVGEYRGLRSPRPLPDWLPDYFFPAPGGGWRGPLTEEERAQKQMGRESGLNRRIRRYLREPGAISPAPDQASLCDWLHHCLRAGLYDEGRRLLDDGHIRLNDLPLEKQMEVEDDAAMCRLRLRQKAQEYVAEPKAQYRTRKTKVVQGTLALE